MTSQVFLRSFGKEGPHAHYEWGMSKWSAVNPLHVPAIQSNFWDLTSLNVHWPSKDRSCLIVELYFASSNKFEPQL